MSNVSHTLPHTHTLHRYTYFSAESDRFITTLVYQKVTHTNQYLTVDLHHLVTQMALVVRTFDEPSQCTIIK